MGKRFFIYITLTIAIAISLSTAYYYFVCHGLRRAKEFYPGRLNAIIYDTVSYDAAFMGGSHVARNIDPVVFDSLTHLRSYNAGIEGISYSVLDLFTRKFIRNHHPKYIIINLDIYTMERENSLWNFPQYYAHLGDPEIATFTHKKPQLLYGKYAPFIAISFMSDYLKGVALDDYLGIYPARDLTYSHRGYSPGFTDDFRGPSPRHALIYSYDTANFKKLDSLCSYCYENRCEVVFIMPPLYNVYEDKNANNKVYCDHLRRIESKYQIKEFNYYFDRDFTKDLFGDASHLNSKGAMIYSRLLADTFASTMNIINIEK